jgi:hypothetical protein
VDEARLAGGPAPVVEAFRLACRKRYRTMGRAWRLALDPGAAGKAAFPRFHDTCRALGFAASASELWAAVDAEGAGFITLKQWDPTTYERLSEFGRACRKNYGCLGQAFQYGMDRDRSGTLPLKELAVFCQAVDYSGNASDLFVDLDKAMKGFVTSDDLDILSTLDIAEVASRRIPKQWTRRAPPGVSRARGFHMAGVDRGTGLLSMAGVEVSTPRSAMRSNDASHNNTLSGSSVLSEALRNLPAATDAKWAP